MTRKILPPALAIVVFSCWFLGASPAIAVPIEVSHPVVDFLRRLEEKGLVQPGFWSTLPRDEAEVARVLQEASTHAEDLSAWDKRRLELYLNEFDPERKWAGTRLRRQDGPFKLLGSVEYYTTLHARDSMPHADVFAFGSLSPGLQATYRDWGYLTSTASVSMERNLHSHYTGENYLPANGLPYSVNREGLNGSSGKVSTFDGFRVVAGVGTGDVHLEAGQDWNQWGPGYWQHATLGSQPYFWVTDSLPASPETGFTGRRGRAYRRGYRFPGEGPPLPQFRIRFGSDHWEYVKIVAQRTGLWKDSSATVVAHRLQFRAGSWRFGATEMLLIGERKTDLFLLLPAVPLKFAEHSGGNQDNSTMSADAEWLLKGFGRLYGELFVDDFSGLPLNYWGDKFAWTVGGSWQDPLGLPAELHLEYAHVDPWVYGHHLHGTQAQSYGALLGSSLPPNSQAIFASADFPLPAGLSGKLEWQLRQRDYRSPGSSIFEVWSSDDGLRKQFLAQDVETRNTLMLSAEWQWKRYLELNAGAGWLDVREWRGRPGASLSTPSFAATLSVRY